MDSIGQAICETVGIVRVVSIFTRVTDAPILPVIPLSYGIPVFQLSADSLAASRKRQTLLPNVRNV